MPQGARQARVSIESEYWQMLLEKQPKGGDMNVDKSERDVRGDTWEILDIYRKFSTIHNKK